jgi:hypothetical protein
MISTAPELSQAYETTLEDRAVAEFVADHAVVDVEPRKRYIDWVWPTIEGFDLLLSSSRTDMPLVLWRRRHPTQPWVDRVSASQQDDVLLLRAPNAACHDVDLRVDKVLDIVTAYLERLAGSCKRLANSFKQIL